MRRRERRGLRQNLDVKLPREPGGSPEDCKVNYRRLSRLLTSEEAMYLIYLQQFNNGRPHGHNDFPI